MTDDAVLAPRIAAIPQCGTGQALARLSPEAATAMAHVARFVDTSLRANGFDEIAGKAG